MGLVRRSWPKSSAIPIKSATVSPTPRTVQRRPAESTIRVSLSPRPPRIGGACCSPGQAEHQEGGDDRGGGAGDDEFEGQRQVLAAADAMCPRTTSRVGSCTTSCVGLGRVIIAGCHLLR